MAQQTRTTLKGYFETGDTPTQAQFEDLIDSNFNLTDNDSDNVTEGATNLFLTTAERSKLSGVEAGADVTDAANVGAVNAAATSKTTPVNADSFPIVDSEASNVIKRLTFTNLITFIQNAVSYITASSSDTLTNKTIDADNNTITNIGTSELTDNGVTFAKLEDIPTNRILGRSTSGTGDVEALTLTGARALLNVEDGADVTDTANVTAAGALMDSEVTNLAQVKTFSSSDYATAAQGATADSALQDVVDDTTPQLGGDLDVNGNDITGNPAIDGRRAIVTEAETERILTLEDAGDFVVTTSEDSDITVIIPTNADVEFPIGTEIDFIQKGAGALTIAGDAAVTLNGVSGGRTAITAQWGGATIKKIDTDEWVIVGKINDVA